MFSSVDDKAWPRALGVKRAVLVTDRRVLRLAGSDANRALKRGGVECFTHLLPEGEEAKTWTAVASLMSAMLDHGFGRDSAIVALGGGSVTDAAGFAASIYLRGIPWASLPTTLLGQLDSGIGGKTGINLPHGKNLAGAFHDPAAVVLDARWLSTLPPRERLSGLAEGLKYGLVFDPALWRLMTSRWKELMDGDSALMTRVVAAGAKRKLAIVARDPHERLGQRELLNFGHTLGHALEKAAGIGSLRHGEAVIWGIRAALRLSVAYAGLSLKEADAAEGFLESLPVPAPSVTVSGILKAARRDKKVLAGKLRFILLRRLGSPVTLPVPERAVEAVVKDLL